MSGPQNILTNGIIGKIIYFQASGNFLGSGNHLAGDAGETGNVNAKALIRTAGDDFVQEYYIFAVFFNGNALIALSLYLLSIVVLIIVAKIFTAFKDKKEKHKWFSQ